MKKNVANQHVAGQMISSVDGSNITSAVSVYVNKDGAGQVGGAGTLAHQGNGAWDYIPTTAETNANHIAFTFTHATGITATVQVYTTYPQTGDSYAEVAHVTYGLSALNTLLGTIAGYIDTEIGTILDRIGAFTGTGVNTVLGFFKALMAKGATNPSDLGALTFNAATDSLEAIEDVGIAGLQNSLNLVSPVTHTPDSVVLTTGTLISGTVANMQSDDNSPYLTAPAAGGLLEDLTFNIGLGYAPISVGINGYFNGAGQYADVWAKDAVLNVWDKLTNSSTRMATRASDANYTYPLSHEHIDPTTGDVVIRFTSPSTNGAHRLSLDRVLVAVVTDIGAGATLTAAEVWSNPERTLTSDTGEPLDTAALVSAIAAAILLNPSNLISVNASNETKIDGSVTITGDVTLAASQPSYDPIDALTTLINGLIGTPADTDIATDLANIAAQISGLGVGGDATLANQVAILNAIGALPVPGDATIINQTAIANAITALGTPQQAGSIVEGAITIEQSLQVILAYVAGRANGGGTPNVKFRDQANSKDRIALTVDANGNRTASVLSLD